MKNLKLYKVLLQRTAFLLIILCAIGMLASCVSQSSMVDSDMTLSEGSGYVFGNFESVNIEAPGAYAFRDSLRLVIENTETQIMYYFLFGPSSERLKVLEVPEGNYVIKKLEAVKKTGMVGSAVHKTTDLMYYWYNLEFEVMPNTAVYLGDFVSDVNKNTGRKNWYLSSPADTFDVTVEEVKKVYPQFATGAVSFTSNIEIPVPDYYVHILQLHDVLTQEEIAKYSSVIEDMVKEF